MSAGVALLFNPTIAGTGCCEVLFSVCDQAVRAAITTLSPSIASLECNMKLELDRARFIITVRRSCRAAAASRSARDSCP